MSLEAHRTAVDEKIINVYIPDLISAVCASLGSSSSGPSAVIQRAQQLSRKMHFSKAVPSTVCMVACAFAIGKSAQLL